jgi:hypothetical protein
MPLGLIGYRLRRDVDSEVQLHVAVVLVIRLQVSIWNVYTSSPPDVSPGLTDREIKERKKELQGFKYTFKSILGTYVGHKGFSKPTSSTGISYRYKIVVK